MVIAGLILVPMFLFYLFITLKFAWGEEGKDERGQKISNKSYQFSAPILPIGWLILETTNNFTSISFDLYRDVIWMLVLLTFIVQGITISRYRKLI